MRKVNHQNDWIWSRSIDDIPDEVRYRDTTKYPDCIGLFLLLTARRMMWILKDRGESWDGQYFRETVIPSVHNFLTDEDNVIDTEDVILLHDKAPGWASNATQEMLREGPIDFFSKSEYPGNSPDLNPCEDVGAIVKDRVEGKMVHERGQGRYSRETLVRNIREVLIEMEFSTDLFEKLLLAYPRRIEAVREANGGHTKH